MTYRYYNIKRDICNDSSEKELKRFRTFNELKDLYKPFHWIIFITMLISLIVMMVLCVVVSNKLWCSIPLAIIIVCTKIWDSKAEELYNKEKRENELKSISSAYEDYLNNIKNILIKNGVDTKEKCECLKKECLSVFELRDAKYSVLNNKVFEMFIGVPIGALISSIMYKDSDAIPIQITVVLLLGIIIYASISLTKFISYHTDGYQKDKQVLDALEEMEYILP